MCHKHGFKCKSGKEENDTTGSSEVTDHHNA